VFVLGWTQYGAQILRAMSSMFQLTMSVHWFRSTHCYLLARAFIYTWCCRSAWNWTSV